VQRGGKSKSVTADLPLESQAGQRRFCAGNGFVGVAAAMTLAR
jgi:hypothetical protein